MRPQERGEERAVGFVYEGGCALGALFFAEGVLPVGVCGGLETEVFGAQGAGVDGEGAGGRGAVGEGAWEEGVVGLWGVGGGGGARGG